MSQNRTICLKIFIYQILGLVYFVRGKGEVKCWEKRLELFRINIYSTLNYINQIHECDNDSKLLYTLQLQFYSITFEFVSCNSDLSCNSIVMRLQSKGLNLNYELKGNLIESHLISSESRLDHSFRQKEIIVRNEHCVIRNFLTLEQK